MHIVISKNIIQKLVILPICLIFISTTACKDNLSNITQIHTEDNVKIEAPLTDEQSDSDDNLSIVDKPIIGKQRNGKRKRQQEAITKNIGNDNTQVKKGRLEAVPITSNQHMPDIISITTRKNINKRKEEKQVSVISKSRDILQSKRKRITDSPYKEAHSKNTNQVLSLIKPNSQIISGINKKQLDLAYILKEEKILKSVLEDLPFKTRLDLTQVSSELYKIINDCEKIGLVGVDKIHPSKHFNPYKIRDYCYTDFSKVAFTTENIPTVPFCRIMQQVTQLPKLYWPYIYKTNIRAIDLAANGMTDNDFVELCGYLQNSRVRFVDLSYNEITDQGVNKIVKEKSLLKKKLKIKLGHNDITESSQELLKSTYPNVTWIF